MDHLLEENVISQKEYDIIRNCTTDKQQTGQLIELVLSKGNVAAEVFRNWIKKNDVCLLRELMAQTNEAASPSQDLSDLPMEEQLRRLQEERTCKVCMGKEVNIVFIPCGHLVVCKECAPSLRKCPICRGLVKGANWEVSYQQDTPVAPRFDINAPDLYIPVMGFITYVLVAGLALGTQNRFSPEILGIQASSALVWLIIEVLAVLLSLYLVTVNTDLTTIDLVAFSGYKYVGMIVGVVAGLLFGRTGYYLTLLWCCVSIFVFTIRTLRLKILSEAAAEGRLVRGAKNQLRMYLTMAIAAAQPVFMYWLTFHLVR
ncbi:unnamed protein product [Leuciscus chuanchicus]